jgi:hypothetical protein
VAVVSDGCGSGKHSEVGSHIAARLLSECIADAAEKCVQQSLESESMTEINWDRVQTLVLSQIAVIAHSMGESFSKTISDYFLFTVVGVVITPWNTFLFSVGDGVFLVNGEVIKLGPFPNNEPPYLAYNLTGSDLSTSNPDLLKIKVDRVIPTDELQSLILGSDGALELINAAEKNLPQRTEVVGDISQFWLNDLYFKNGDAVRRRLAVINKEATEIVSPNVARIIPGLLSDDTTLVVIRRDPHEEEED